MRMIYSDPTAAPVVPPTARERVVAVADRLRTVADHLEAAAERYADTDIEPELRDLHQTARALAVEAYLIARNAL